MNLQSIKNRIRFYTGTDSAQYADQNILDSINEAKNEFVLIALQAQDECRLNDLNASEFPEASYDLVANQDNYAFPDGLLKLNRVDITYDGTNWVKATPLSKGEIGTAVYDKSMFSTTKPYYYSEYGSIFPLPVPTADIDGGMKVYFDKGIEDFTTTDLADTDFVPGIPEIFHKFLIISPVVDWCMVKDQNIADRFERQKAEIIINIKKHYSKQNNDRQYAFIPSIPDLS